jgi:hypothetical protein
MNKYSTTPLTDAALQSLDGMQRAEAPPFLHTRIEAALRSEAEPARGVMAWLLKPAVVLAGLALIVGLNAWLISGGAGNGVLPATGATDELVADAYNIDFTMADDFENSND